MVTTIFRKVTLSASVTANASETGVHPVPVHPVRHAGAGDFAGRHGGKVRRNDRRAAIARKRAWLEG